MKVNLVVHSLDIKNMGGVNRVTIDLAHALLEENIDITIYSLGEINNFCCDISDKIKIISLGMLSHSTNEYVGLRKIKWFKESYDLLQVEICNKKDEIWVMSSPPLNLLISFLKFKFPYLKVIGCDHTSTTYSKGFFVDKLKYTILKKNNYMIALTLKDKKNYEKKGLKTVFIPNFIDLSSVSTIFNKRKYLIFVGRLSEEKQPIEALKVYALSRLWEKNINLRVFGSGNLHAEVLDFIYRNDLHNYVDVITNETDPNCIYKDAYALLMTSRVEGFGMVLLEAISRNIPCVAYNVPYGPESILNNGENGYLVEFGDLSGAARTLNLDNLKKMHDQDIKSTLKSFSKDAVISKWLEVLNNV